MEGWERKSTAYAEKYISEDGWVMIRSGGRVCFTLVRPTQQMRIVGRRFKTKESALARYQKIKFEEHVPLI